MINMKLGQKIATLRKKNQISQEELAEKMHVSRQAVSKWESDQSLPDIDKIVDLSELFGVTTDYLLKNGTHSFDVKQEEQQDLQAKLPILSDEEIENYQAAGTSASKITGLALSLIGLACACFCFFMSFWNNADWASLWGATIFIILCAIAAGLLVRNYLIMREFKQIRSQNFDLKQKQLSKVKNDFTNFRQLQNRKIIAATVCIILAIIPPFISGIMLNNHTQIDWTSLAYGFSCILFSIALYLLVSYYLEQRVFTTLTKQEKHQFFNKNKHALIAYTALYWLCYLLIWWLLRQMPYQYPFMSSDSIFFLALVIYGICYIFFFYKQQLK